MGRSMARVSGPCPHSRPVLAFVHHHIQPPGEAVSHSPVLAGNLVEPLWSECRSQQIISRFRRALFRCFTHLNHYADGLQASLLVLLSWSKSISVDTDALHVSMHP
jgi:hypothetical protein